MSRSIHAYRAGVFVAVLAVATAIVLIPFAAISVLHKLQQPVEGRAYPLVRANGLLGDSTELNIAATGLDESAQTVTLRVTGFRNCGYFGCAEPERVQIYSVDAAAKGALGTPPSATVDLPQDSSDIDQDVTLPIRGNLVDYPFDRYHLLLGVSFAHLTAKGVAVPFSLRAAEAGFAYTLDDGLARATMAPPKLLDPRRYDSRGVTYESVAAVSFSRPAYLQIMTLDLTLLIVIAAIYGVVFRPFTQIIPTVGGIVLGVWGVRSLVVGGYPPDSTGVDLVLEAAIFLVLLVVGIRSVMFMWPRTHFARPR